MYKALATLVFVSALSYAHEGDHGPSNVPLQKGGIMRTLETVNLELVYKDKMIAIYTFETAMDPQNPGKLKAADPARYPVSATLELPKSKPRNLELKTMADRWEAVIDPKGAHRFTVILNIKQGGHSDRIKWTVEPKK